MGTTIAIGSAPYARVAQWLYEEARLLDRGRFAEWLGLLAPDIAYRMPVRAALLPRDGQGYDEQSGFFVENRASLGARVGRLATDQAWADQPASRTRHFVSNVLVEETEDGSYAATSAILLTRIRSDLPYDLFTGERQDVLREENGSLLLAKRTILLDQTILKSNNLSMFF